MVKCNADQVRRLQRALKREKNAKTRQRIQMVLLRESGMTQPEIADATGVSLSTVNRAHMAYDHGGRAALAPKPSGGRIRENMTLAEEKALLDRFANAGLTPGGAQQGRGRFIRPKRASSANIIRNRRPRFAAIRLAFLTASANPFFYSCSALRCLGRDERGAASACANRGG